MSLLWKTATDLTGSADDPDYFDHVPYSTRLTRHLIETRGQGGADNICMCEHEEHTKKSSVSEGMHPLYSAEAEGQYSHPWVGPLCDDCATGHMSDTNVQRTPAA